ncbi:hypothetical protein E2C01_064298 [Portunus trituberculatus]|uniref:Uncharacterized protein n=1 Tax=Portunus trituberculatus TaxID=210409 RepID=A0A5B7HJZ7_PORTR|nr:hypothetical protein [Portunus trituberculatus]
MQGLAARDINVVVKSPGTPENVITVEEQGGAEGVGEHVITAEGAAYLTNTGRVRAAQRLVFTASRVAAI